MLLRDAELGEAIDVCSDHDCLDLTVEGSRRGQGLKRALLQNSTIVSDEDQDHESST